MQRKPVIVAILTLLGFSGYFLWAYSSVREGFDPDNEFANWPPTAATIQKSLPAGTPAEREKAFVLLFQQRFRNHDPGKAIGIRFKDGKIRLLTPARLEPWHIDRIAMMLYQESQQDFNKTYDIDIYETFIGTPPIKIGELRASPKTSAQVNVVYHYPVGAIFTALPHRFRRPVSTGRSGLAVRPSPKPL